jgi:hypothetical protein
MQVWCIVRVQCTMSFVCNHARTHIHARSHVVQCATHIKPLFKGFKSGALHDEVVQRMFEIAKCLVREYVWVRARVCCCACTSLLRVSDDVFACSPSSNTSKHTMHTFCCRSAMQRGQWVLRWCA